MRTPRTKTHGSRTEIHTTDGTNGLTVSTEPLVMQLDPSDTAVVVVDMQNGFCHPKGSLYAPKSEAAIDPCTGLVADARDAGVSVVFTRDVHPPEQFEDAHYYDEFERWGDHAVEGSWDAELVAELDPRDSELVVVKHTYDAFYRTELEGYLESHGIRDLVICGTLANVCVLHTAGSAGLRDYRPILLEDAVGAIEAEHREYALDHAEWLFGEVEPRSEITFA